MSSEYIPQKLNDIVTVLQETGLPFVLTAQIDDQTYFTTAKVTASSGELMHLLLMLCQAYAEVAEDEQSKLALH